MIETLIQIKEQRDIAIADNYRLKEKVEEMRDEVRRIRQCKEDLIEVILGLNETLNHKEEELNNVSNRLNHLYLSTNTKGYD
jgi:chromosome segregation ATPase